MRDTRLVLLLRKEILILIAKNILRETKDYSVIYGFAVQCGKPLFGKSNVVVDHIMPLKHGGVNRTFNCVAICEKCNAKKGAKVDHRVLKDTLLKPFKVPYSLHKEQ